MYGLIYSDLIQLSDIFLNKLIQHATANAPTIFSLIF